MTKDLNDQAVLDELQAQLEIGYENGGAGVVEWWGASACETLILPVLKTEFITLSDADEFDHLPVRIRWTHQLEDDLGPITVRATLDKYCSGNATYRIEISD